MVVYNVFGSEEYAAFNRQQRQVHQDLQQRRAALDASGAKGQTSARDYANRLDAVERLNGAAGARVGLAAKSLNFMVIRHEGTHQFFHTIGLDQTPMGQQLWLGEGLAAYAEPSSVGDRNGERLALIKDAVSHSAHVPLRDLVQSDAAFTSGDGQRALLAYAESWSLVYYLMHSPLREEFFRYLAAVRSTAAAGEPSGEQRVVWLERHLGTSLEQLEGHWAQFVAGL